MAAERPKPNPIFGLVTLPWRIVSAAAWNMTGLGLAQNIAYRRQRAKGHQAAAEESWNPLNRWALERQSREHEWAAGILSSHFGPLDK